ncbi:hypothetical protein L211DRAFT_565116 [Terfezia boudieri ATCC MYA-4762]|uniref:Uncharacterized protein n=1 Tax=Terfezia boudieri ATCC MYA-4762 TaxID=1051890 RepID=A0A3N4LXQ9_9PEZI|nr:hypothetical protein L211DRAFT_565116 [Terfezia boudieri ATCC MYA-4762]
MDFFLHLTDRHGEEICPSQNDNLWKNISVALFIATTFGGTIVYIYNLRTSLLQSFLYSGRDYVQYFFGPRAYNAKVEPVSSLVPL